MFHNWTKCLSICRTIMIDPDQYLCRLCRHWLILIYQCVDNKLDTSWLLLRSQTNSLSFCRVVLIDPDQHFCRFCRHLLTLIHPCDDSVEWNRPWYAHESTLSYKIGPDMLMCRHCRKKSPVHSNFAVEQNVCRSVELYWLTLINICVDSGDINWYSNVSTLSTEIAHDMLMCWHYRMKSSLQTHVSSLSNKIEPDMLMCRHCRMNATLIIPWVDSNWPC